MGLDRRKRSGRIFAGSQLNVDGQGIYTVKIIILYLFQHRYI
jgi:hypothetical protein